MIQAEPAPEGSPACGVGPEARSGAGPEVPEPQAGRSGPGHASTILGMVSLILLCACQSGGWITQTSAAFGHLTTQATESIASGEIECDVQAYFATSDELQRRLLRDRVATRILLVIDGEYQVFRQRNASVRAHISAGLDMSALGLGARSSRRWTA